MLKIWGEKENRVGYRIKNINEKEEKRGKIRREGRGQQKKPVEVAKREHAYR